MTSSSDFQPTAPVRRLTLDELSFLVHAMGLSVPYYLRGTGEAGTPSQTAGLRTLILRDLVRFADGAAMPLLIHPSAKAGAELVCQPESALIRSVVQDGRFLALSRVLRRAAVLVHEQVVVPGLVMLTPTTPERVLARRGHGATDPADSGRPTSPSRITRSVPWRNGVLDLPDDWSKPYVHVLASVDAAGVVSDYAMWVEEGTSYWCPQSRADASVLFGSSDAPSVAALAQGVAERWIRGATPTH
jgi:hypothetical protein